MKIANKTDSEMFVDFVRCSLVSFEGETRFLQRKQDDSHIPPRSYLIVESGKPVLFCTDIDKAFAQRDGPSDVGVVAQILPPEKDILEPFIGRKVGFFLPVTINDTETIYDLVLGVIEVGQKQRYIEKLPWE